MIFEYALYPDGQHRFHFVSDRSRDMLGIAPCELMADASLAHSLLADDGTNLFGNGGSIGKKCDSIVRVRVNGKTKTLCVSFVDQAGEHGVILRRGTIHEMPEGYTADLITGGYRYQDLLERLPIGVVIHRAGTVLYANRHAHNLVGATAPGQLIGADALSFVHPDCQPGIHERIKRVQQGKAVPMVEEKFVRLDGRVIEVESLAFPFLYHGQPAVQVVFRDVTEKKRAEALVLRSEILFRQLFQNVPLAVAMLDEFGKVSEVNHGFEEMFGYEREELKGLNLNDFIVPDDLRNEGIDLNNLITSNRSVSIESVRRHKSGRLVSVILCGVPVILENRVIGIYGVYVDITDRKRVEEELKIRNAELDNFVYKVSHDLRAPLSSVLGLVNLSKLQGNTDDPIVYLELIGEKIQALDNFIGDVLSHSKNLKMDVNIGQVKLDQIIDQTFADLSYLKGARKTRRSVKIEGIDFYSDQWRISEIFRNLVSNAIKYRRPDADDSEIVIKVKVDHLCADISFADNGMGINEANLQRVFEMFYRATEQGEGSGIGLYIVKNAVEKLGGQIRVASQLNHGTRFHILLPNRINGIAST